MSAKSNKICCIFPNRGLCLLTFAVLAGLVGLLTYLLFPKFPTVENITPFLDQDSDISFPGQTSPLGIISAIMGGKGLQIALNMKSNCTLVSSSATDILVNELNLQVLFS